MLVQALNPSALPTEPRFQCYFLVPSTVVICRGEAGKCFLFLEVHEGLYYTISDFNLN
jgi:hypothetical protein